MSEFISTPHTLPAPEEQGNFRLSISTEMFSTKRSDDDANMRDDMKEAICACAIAQRLVHLADPLMILLSKDLKAVAPGCTPLRFHYNQKGNLIITFTPTTPRSLLMSKLDVIRGTFELVAHVPILFDTPRSTIHLANVPAHSMDSGPVFDQTALADSILANPALSAPLLTSQPRWLRHPSKTTGARSSAVLAFEDPDGTIARQLLKAQIFVFGQLVTVKPWVNKPTLTTRQPQISPNLGSATDSEMDTN
ncbi:hypothetical protein FRC11_006013 [Ceratobasidium sp. 423]|nr:hypothetical protein FRC11_006013 [Ceratobasidium sp. 423]